MVQGLMGEWVGMAEIRYINSFHDIAPRNRDNAVVTSHRDHGHWHQQRRNPRHPAPRPAPCQEHSGLLRVAQDLTGPVVRAGTACRLR